MMALINRTHLNPKAFIEMENESSIYLIMPHGTTHGWGVCGRYLASELHQMTDLKYVTVPFELKDIGNETQYRQLTACHLPLGKLKRSKNKSQPIGLDAPAIQTIEDIHLRPWLLKVKGTRNIGYTFFEGNILSPEDLQWADQYYDTIAVGSSWCETVLNEHGFNRTRTIVQGVDPSIFHPAGEKQRYADYFVIFSGGKFELRKGQDIAIRAVKILQDRYPDVLLVTSWYNHWPESMNTMAASPYIKYQSPSDNYGSAMKQILALNGLDLQKVAILPPLQNDAMPQVYRDSDIGLFPNRCEGGTNLVMMEYMACGRPVVASYLTGHRDVLGPDYACLVKARNSFNIQHNGRIFAKWEDPDLDETLAHLDWAYHHREEIRSMGQRAALSMSSFTWQKAARGFLDLL
jgi:glycosyltransferase involved in cell wall biosynthesis